ncbi:MAG TPA: YciI family protein [Myxococcaceae bacterium]
MPSSFFFARLVPNRPDFVMTMTPEERATMGAHAGFLQSQLAAGTLVAAGPVMDPAGPFGMALFEAESLDAVQRLLEKDPARAIGRYEIAPMGPVIARPARPAGA